MDIQQHVPNTLSLAFSEDLYAAWLADPLSVPENWRQYFAGLGIGTGVSPATRRPWASASTSWPSSRTGSTS